MLYGIPIEHTVIDLRFIPTLLLAFYGGIVPACLSLLLTFIGRLYLSVNQAAYFSILMGVLKLKQLIIIQIKTPVREVRGQALICFFVFYERSGDVTYI